jgi:uncharacterized repeat protein (TIGR03803 family)
MNSPSWSRMTALSGKFGLAFGLGLALFSLPPSAAQAYTLKILHSFCAQSGCPDGAEPEATLLMDSSGNLYGTTLGGGDHSRGTVFELAPNADKSRWKHKLLYSFCFQSDCKDGQLPTTPVIIDSSGALFGTTSAGGKHNSGVAFRLKKKAGVWSLKVLYTFCKGGVPCADGDIPGRPTYIGAASGSPYDGTSPLFSAATGGGNGTQPGGVIFQLTPIPGKVKRAETVLYNFCSEGGANCTDGRNPVGSPILDAAGNMFGTTFVGGAFELGTVFEFSPDLKETVLYSFCPGGGNCVDGQEPQSTPLKDGSGNLFGTTPKGGPNCTQGSVCGVVFRLVPNGTQSQYSVVYGFCALADCADGATPTGDLIMDEAGALYGTTTNGGGNDIDTGGIGGGTVFKLSGATLETLYSFCAQASCADGEYPAAGLVMDAAGNLYGTTRFGGTNAKGIVFELTP